jgi:hypothetical protein
VNQQGIPFSIPCWAFTLVVFLPVVGAVIAEILIYLKLRPPEDY